MTREIYEVCRQFAGTLATDNTPIRPDTGHDWHLVSRTIREDSATTDVVWTWERESAESLRDQALAIVTNVHVIVGRAGAPIGTLEERVEWLVVAMGKSNDLYRNTYRELEQLQQTLDLVRGLVTEGESCPE